MTNFLPLKRYFFYCLDKCMEQYGLSPPFLDIGCGVGDLSAYMGRKGWHGKAIDSSAKAIRQAQENLRKMAHVEVEQTSLFEVKGVFRTIFLWDVLEHIERDGDALQKIASLLSPKGHLILTVPSNLREWRWDDDFYGHLRRYATEELKAKLRQAGLEPLCAWEVFFPFFWAMRRIYTRLWRRTPGSINKEELTQTSALTPAWRIPALSSLLNIIQLPWYPLYRVQFLFRNFVERGNELFVIAQKKGDPALP